MPTYRPPFDQQNRVITSALRVIQADNYSRPDDPHEDAEREYAAEQLALAARGLVLAVSSKPADEQPLGWRPDPGEVRHVYLDTEFMRADLTELGLVSLALTDDQDNDYYAINWQMDASAVREDAWMRDNVWPYLPLGADDDVDWKHPDVRRYSTIRDEVAAYFANTTATTTYLYANHGAQDIVRLHGLWNHDWTVMPDAVPRWFTDIKGLIAASGIPADTIPEQPANAHHPLDDARYNRFVRHYLAAL